MIHYEKLLSVAPELALPGELLQAHREQIVNYAQFGNWARQRQISWPVGYRDEQGAKEAAWNMFVLSLYVAEGERVFRVEPGLARLLLDTDLPKITGEEFHLPFSALYLEFPGKLFVVPEEEWVLIGCYVLDHRPYDNIVSVDFVLEPQKGEVHGLGEFLIQVNIDVTPGRQINWNDLMSGFEKSLFAINPFKSAAEDAAKMAGFASEVVELVVNSVL